MPSHEISWKFSEGRKGNIQRKIRSEYTKTFAIHACARSEGLQTTSTQIEDDAPTVNQVSTWLLAGSVRLIAWTDADLERMITWNWICMWRIVWAIGNLENGLISRKRFYTVEKGPSGLLHKAPWQLENTKSILWTQTTESVSKRIRRWFPSEYLIRSLSAQQWIGEKFDTCILVLCNIKYTRLIVFLNRIFTVLIRYSCLS